MTVQYKTVFELFQKLHPLIYASQFFNNIMNYPTFIYTIESGNCGKKMNKLQQCAYLEKKELLKQNKKFFVAFEGLSFGEKISNSGKEL